VISPSADGDKGFSPLTSVAFFVKKAPQKNFKKVLRQAQLRDFSSRSLFY